VIGLFPELDFGQLAVVPAIANDAVGTGRRPGQVCGLGCASDSGKSRHNICEGATLEEAVDARSVGAEQRFS
jgi:hypothetical protein